MLKISQLVDTSKCSRDKISENPDAVNGVMDDCYLMSEVMYLLPRELNPNAKYAINPKG